MWDFLGRLNLKTAKIKEKGLIVFDRVINNTVTEFIVLMTKGESVFFWYGYPGNPCGKPWRPAAT